MAAFASERTGKTDSQIWVTALRHADNTSIPAAAIRPAHPDRAPVTADELNLPDRMGGPNPRVSVIVPTYLDSDYLPDALESIGAQRFTDLEVIIVDSSREDWVAGLAADRPWIRYVPTEPSGVSAARNTGLGQAGGPYVAFLDADDYWHPDKLSHQLDHLENGYSVTYTGYYFLNFWKDEKGEVTSRDVTPVATGNTAVELVKQSIDAHISTVVCRADELPPRPFDESLQNFEDVVFAIDRVQQGSVYHDARPLAVRRLRPGSLADRTSVPKKSQDRIAAYRHLAMEYPDLAPAAKQMIATEYYRAGLFYLRQGEDEHARDRFLESMHQRPGLLKAPLMYLLSFLPGDTAELFDRVAEMVGTLREGEMQPLAQH